MRSRAQIFTWDLVFSIILFAVTLTALFYLLDSTSRSLRDSEEYYDMGWVASLLGEQIVRLPGVPEDWSEDDVIVFGLAEDETVLGFEGVRDRVINPRKFLSLVNMTYNDYAGVKARMTRNAKYDFYINFSCRGEVGGDPLHCFKNLPVYGMGGVVHCANRLSIFVKDNRTRTAPENPPPAECIVGRPLPLSWIDYAASNVKNAVFNEEEDLTNLSFDTFSELNKTLVITVVVYTSSPDWAITTTTSTTSTITTSTTVTTTTSTSTSSTSTTSTSTTSTLPVGACPGGMSGEGTVGDPCMVTDCTQLQAMNDDPVLFYGLVGDIDCSATNPADPANPGSVWDNGGLGFDPVGEFGAAFTGGFYGNEHTISDLFIDRPSEDDVGLFGYVSGASVTDVGLEGVDVSGGSNVGALVGQNWDGAITNSYSTGVVFASGFGVGGLVAYHWGGTLENSYSTADVNGGDIAGGLVGASRVLISNLYATGDVSGGNAVGGLVGLTDSTIRNSYSTGSVTGATSVGGLVGGNSGILENCFWNNHPGNPDDCYDGGNTGCTAVDDNEAYFFDVADTNPPYDVWNFPPWDTFCDDNGFPPLAWEGISNVNDCRGYAPTTQPLVQRGPTVVYLDDTSEFITFEANRPVNYLLEYGITTAYGQSESSAAFNIRWEVLLTGLDAGTTYYYRLRVQDEVGDSETETGSFTTADSADTQFGFVVLGDNRPVSGWTQPAVFSTLLSNSFAKGPLFYLSTGDIVQLSDVGNVDPTEARLAWEGYTNLTGPYMKYVPFYHSIGNHEYPVDDDALGRWREVWHYPENGAGSTWGDCLNSDCWREVTYWWEYGNSLFVSLNSEEPGDNEEDIAGDQLTWLTDTLQKTGYAHKFVYVHRSIQGSTRTDYDNKDLLDQMFSDNDVTVVFQGHDHHWCNYTSGRDVVYVTTGGGGAPLYDAYCEGDIIVAHHYTYVYVNGDTVELIMYDDNDIERERITLG